MNKLLLKDLRRQYLKYRRPIDKLLKKQLLDTDFINGYDIELLEDQLSAYVGVKHTIACANGTDAMVMVLQAWGIGSGDCVFVPNFTFFATAEVVCNVGATPIFVDVEPNTFNISVNSLQEAYNIAVEDNSMTPRAVIAVDLFGLPANYDKLTKFCNDNKLKLLEDSAQGFGGEISSKKAGSFGDAATTSFFPAKPLGCYGDGGAIFTNDYALDKVLRSLRSHGKGETRYDNIRIGFNSRLDTIQAKVLLVKLSAFSKHELEDVNILARRYDRELDKRIKIPLIPDNMMSSYAQYTLRFDSTILRDYVICALEKKNIQTQVYYPIPLDKQAAFENIKKYQIDLSNSKLLCDTCLSIPLHPYLKKREQDYIISSINSVIVNYYSGKEAN